MTESTSTKRPTHTIYKVTGEGEDARWVKVGVGFPHMDGYGLNLMFDGIPVEGRIALRKNRDRKDKPAELPQEALPAHAQQAAA